MYVFVPVKSDVHPNLIRDDQLLSALKSYTDFRS